VVLVSVLQLNRRYLGRNPRFCLGNPGTCDGGVRRALRRQDHHASDQSRENCQQTLHLGPPRATTFHSILRHTRLFATLPAILFVAEDLSISRSGVRLATEYPRGDVPAAKRKPIRSKHMRFMVMVKATKNSEAGILPSQELLAAMGKYNE